MSELTVGFFGALAIRNVVADGLKLVHATVAVPDGVAGPMDEERMLVGSRQLPLQFARVARSGGRVERLHHAGTRGLVDTGRYAREEALAEQRLARAVDETAIGLVDEG